MLSLSIVVILALFKRASLVTAKYYKVSATADENWFSEGVKELPIIERPIELATLKEEPRVSVATFREDSWGYKAAKFWFDDDTIVAFSDAPSKWGSFQHAGFDLDPDVNQPFKPIYFAKKTATARGVVTKVHGDTFSRAGGFKTSNDFRTGPYRFFGFLYKNEGSQLAFCPCPFGDVVVTGGRLNRNKEPYRNKNSYPMILSVMERGTAQAAGCIPTTVDAEEIAEEEIVRVSQPELESQ